jgi:hypothetical protein
MKLEINKVILLQLKIIYLTNMDLKKKLNYINKELLKMEI